MSIEEKLGDKFSKVTEIVEKLANLRMELGKEKSKESEGKENNPENERVGEEKVGDLPNKEKEQNTLVQELFEALTGKESEKNPDKTREEDKEKKPNELESGKNKGSSVEDSFTRAFNKVLKKPKDKPLDSSKEKPLTAEELLSEATKALSDEFELTEEEKKKKEPKAPEQKAIIEALDKISNELKMKNLIKEFKDNPAFKEMANKGVENVNLEPGKIKSGAEGQKNPNSKDQSH